MKKLLIILLAVGLVVPTFAQEKLSKKERKIQGYAEMKELVESGEFGFQARDARTQRGRTVMLTTNANSLGIAEGNIVAQLPYFGVAQYATMSGDAGISMKGKFDSYEVDYKDSKKKIIIRFKTTSNGEVFNCTLTIFWSKNATLNISSTRRDRISYNGQINPLKE